jgi:hypothetical protein
MGEEWSCRANRTMKWYRAAGGKLAITDGRLEFRPHAADRALGADAWSVGLDEVRAVGREPRGLNPLNGALRERLRVETRSGPPELFVVSKLDDVIARIESSRPGGGA